MKTPGGAMCWLAAGLMLASMSSGCSTLNACEASDDEPVAYKGGITADGYYLSSAWSGPFLSFPAGKRYALYHGLGCVPMHVAVWVSFSENGAGEGSSMAPSAGNMSIVEAVTEQYIQVKNDTCSDMYLLVEASGCLPSDGGVEGGR
jgi:hypothetical protein